MTNAFDAADIREKRTSGRSLKRNYEKQSCGANLNWSLGLRALPELAGRSPNVSGSLLAKVIEGEIIPRLLLSHQRFADATKSETGLADLAEIGASEEFARLVLTSETEEIVERVEALQACGIKLERIMLDLLAPVARKLGELWEDDLCTFVDVTLGLARLHQVLHEIARRRMDGTNLLAAKRRAYFVPSPGEQHTFGLSMLEEFFLHAGWETASNHCASASTILESVSTQNLDILGFSVGCHEFLDPLFELIERARKSSLNPDIIVMVGGRFFLDNPGMATKLGPAIVVSDGVHAVHLADKLVSRVAVAVAGEDEMLP